MRGLLTFCAFILMGSVAFAEGVTENELVSVVQKNLSEIKRCYAGYLRRAPGRKGKVIFDFVVLPAGHVTNIVFRTSDFGDALFFACLTPNVANWKFPAHSSQTEVKDFFLNLHP